MFRDSVRSILAKAFSKAESQQEDQHIAKLGARKRSKLRREEMAKLIEPESELDEAREIACKHGTNDQHRETISTKEEALLPSQEDADAREDDDGGGGDDDLILVRTRLRVLQILNGKLMTELADAKVSAERYLQDYEKERNARKFVEDICTELKKKLAATLKNLDSMKLEVEKIEVGAQIRECALQMKLEDARLILEKKYDDLDYWQGQLEVFVRKNRSNCAPKLEVINEAEILLEEVCMVRQSGV